MNNNTPLGRDMNNNTPVVIKIAMLISMGSFLIAMILLITLILLVKY